LWLVSSQKFLISYLVNNRDYFNKTGAHRTAF
jgi:hypothetical protein